MAPAFKRKRETLSVVAWHFENGKNVSKTAAPFSIHRKEVTNWVKVENFTRKQKCNTRSRRFKEAKYPLMEKRLHDEFLKL